MGDFNSQLFIELAEAMTDEIDEDNPGDTWTVDQLRSIRASKNALWKVLMYRAAHMMDASYQENTAEEKNRVAMTSVDITFVSKSAFDGIRHDGDHDILSLGAYYPSVLTDRIRYHENKISEEDNRRNSQNALRAARAFLTEKNRGGIVISDLDFVRGGALSKSGEAVAEFVARQLVCPNPD